MIYALITYLNVMRNVDWCLKRDYNELQLLIEFNKNLKIRTFIIS